jgi:hypothetical protein
MFVLGAATFNARNEKEANNIRRETRKRRICKRKKVIDESPVLKSRSNRIVYVF